MSRLSEWKEFMTGKFDANVDRWDKANKVTQECARTARATTGGRIARMKAYFNCRTGKRLRRSERTLEED